MRVQTGTKSQVILAATLSMLAMGSSTTEDEQPSFRVGLNAVKQELPENKNVQRLTSEQFLEKKRTKTGNKYRSASEYLRSFLPWDNSRKQYSKVQKKRLRATDTQNAMTHKTVYAGPIYLGTLSTELNVIYDTNERWLSIEATGCDGCEGTLYDPSTSTDNVDQGVSVFQNLDHLDVEFRSDEALDKACINPASATPQYCTDTATVLMMTKAWGVSPDYSGFLGLNFGAKDTDTQNILLIPRIQSNPTATAMSLSLFALYYNNGQSTGSFADFGQADTSLYKSGSSPVYFPVDTGDFQWTVDLNSVHFVNDDPEKDAERYFYMNYWAVVSSSHEMIYIPKTLGDSLGGGFDMNPFFYWLLKDRDYDTFFNDYYIEIPTVETEYIVDCEDDDKPWENVEFLINDNWLVIEPSQYLIPQADNPDECKLAFVESSISTVVLGSRAFWGYYMIHDYTNSQLGVVPTTSGGRSDLSIKSGEEFYQEFYIPFNTANFIFGTFVLGGTFIAWFVVFFSYIDSFPDLQLDGPIDEEPNEDELQDFQSKQLKQKESMTSLLQKLQIALEKNKQ